MKTIAISGILILLLCQTYATTIFSCDFETPLSGWVGQNAGAYTGTLVLDPIQSDHALSFTGLASGGDIFTEITFNAGNYIVSYDYLGRPGMGGVAGDLGGYMGFSYGLPLTHYWLAGTSNVAGADPMLIDDGQWHHYTISFTATASFHILFEDFIGAGGVAGDALFDNLLLTDSAGPTPVPEPGTWLCLVFGITLLYRKWQK